MKRSSPKNPVLWRLRSAVLLWVVLMAPGLAPAQELNIDSTLGNSPYNVTGNINFGSENIGTAGTGVLNQGAFTNFLVVLNLGQNAGSSGTYNLSGNGALVGSTIWENIGGAGNGTFNQTGGTNSGSGNPNILAVGGNANASGTYILSGGTLSVANQWVSGVNGGSGTFTQSGGSNMCIALVVGLTSSGVGTYTLSGTGTLRADQAEFIGDQGGSGTFTQTGGTNSTGYSPPDQALVLGSTSGSSGTYNLSGGSLTATPSETIGDQGSGTFNQNGGTNTVNGNLILGNSLGGVGTYTLNNGVLTANGTEIIGNAGSGTFYQYGGTNVIQNLLTIGSSGGSAHSTYNYFGGVLEVPAVQVNHTGVLQGFGTISGAAVNNAGVVHPSFYSPLNVGQYTQAATGHLQIDIVPGLGANAYSRLNTITTSLNGMIKPVVYGNYPTIGQVFPGVVTASEGLTGTFSGIDKPLIVTWQVVYNPKSVDLIYQGANYAFGGLAHNPLAVGIALNLAALNASGDMLSVLNAIDNLPNVAAIQNAYKQISPEKTGAFSTLGFALAANQMRNLSQRITDLRFGAGQTASGLGPGSFNLTYSRVGGLMLAYNSSNLSGLITAKQERAPAGPWSVYLQPNLILGAQATTANQTGFDFTVAGFTLGADYRLRDDLLLGLATGYSNTDARFRGSGGSVTNNTWPLMVYAAYLPQPFYAFGSLGYNLNLLNLERHLSFGGVSRSASGSTTGNQLNAYGETGYDFKVRKLVATPMVSLAYSQLWVNGYTENGAGSLSLGVGPQSATSLQTGVGAKVALPFKRDATLMVPQVYASYQHEFLNNSRGLDARLSQAGNSTFTWQTDRPQRDFAVLGANCTVSQGRFTLQLDYNTEVGRGNYTAHNVNAAVRWQF